MKNNIVFLYAFCFFFSMGIFAQTTQLPDFALTTLEGQKKELATNTAKLIYFFDHQQIENKDAFQTVNKIAYAFRTQKLQVLAIYTNSDSADLSELKETLSPLGLLYPIYLDSKAQALAKLEMQEAPVLLIANAENTILYHVLENSVSYHDLKQQVEAALGFIKAEPLKETSSSRDLFSEKDWVSETEKLSKTQALEVAKEATKEVKKVPQEKPLTEVEPGKNQHPKEATSEIKSDVAIPVSPLRLENEAFTKIPVVTVLGQKGWGELSSSFKQETVPSNFGFDLWVDIFIRLLPLFIWGWGMLFTLAKALQYKGMLWGFLACFIFFALHAIHVLVHLPWELSILSYDLNLWKNTVLPYYGYLQDGFINSGILIVCQFALLAGLAGRHKNEQGLAL